MKREEVTRFLGSPTVVKSEGDEFWFYSRPELDEVLVVRFRSAEGFTADEVYVSRLTFAKRQWYPFLGEPPDGSQPLRIADTKLGNFALGDHVLDNPMNFSEGRTAPYDTHESKALGIKLFSFNGVQAIWVRGKSVVRTPRGIGIGSTSADVAKAYGQARVGEDSIQSAIYWSYESIRNGFGLVFEMVNDKVVAINLATTDFQFRPTVEAKK